MKVRLRNSKLETQKWAGRYLPTCPSAHLTALLAFTLYTLAFCSSAWGAYSYRRTITVDHTKCGASNSTNFPMLFSGVYSYLATVANGGKIQNTSGSPAVPDDLIFTSDAAGSNLLNWEVEYYDPTTGTISVWIKIPTLSSSANTVIYMWYGNAAVTSFQGGATGSAWDSSFQAVWHFGLTANDSTANSNNGTWYGNQTGTNGYYSPGDWPEWAGTFDGTTDYMNVGNTAPDTSNFTVSFWVKPPSLGSGTQGFIVNKRNYPTAGYCVLTNYPGNGQIQFIWQTFSGSFAQIFTNNLYGVGTWLYVVVAQQNGSATFYVNGNEDSNQSISNPGADSTNLILGTWGGAHFTGLLDEVRFSSTARSADWVLAEYNNQNSPSTFYSVGGVAYSASPSETHPASDAVSELGSHFAGPAETHMASDTIAGLGTHFAAPVETHAASDAMGRRAAFSRAEAETLTTSAATVDRGAHFATPAEMHAASDAIVGLGGHFVAPAETHIASDRLARLAAFSRSDAEALTLADAVSGSWEIGQAPVLGRHQLAAPGQAKTGSVPGKTKTGSTPPH